MTRYAAKLAQAPPKQQVFTFCFNKVKGGVVLPIIVFFSSNMAMFNGVAAVIKPLQNFGIPIAKLNPKNILYQIGV